jgi:hypothetical protein
MLGKVHRRKTERARRPSGDSELRTNLEEFCVHSRQNQNATRARIRRVAMHQAPINSSNSCIRLESIMHANELVVEDTSLYCPSLLVNDDNVMQRGSKQWANACATLVLPGNIMGRARRPLEVENVSLGLRLLQAFSVVPSRVSVLLTAVLHQAPWRNPAPAHVGARNHI